MNAESISPLPVTLMVELYQPKADVFYSLDAAAHLAAVSRRSILVYCRVGLIRPIFQPPYGVMAFTEEAVYSIRRIEDLKAIHGLNVAWIKTLFDLVDEVEHLRAEMRFFRNH